MISSLQSSPSPLSPNLIPQTFDQLDGWFDEEHMAAFRCFLLSARRMQKKSYSTKSLGVCGTALARIATTALVQQISDNESARRFFQENFRPHKYMEPSCNGFLTGYFSPQLLASSIKSAQFRFPLYRKPEDLIEINDANRPEGMDKSFVFGRQTTTGIEEYFDRRQIQEGILKGKGLELFWLQDPVDIFFVHIQGSACLTLEDGCRACVSYAAKSGHPYTPIGKVLAQRGDLRLEEITMQSIVHWINNNPEKRDALLASNRSYIFFKKMEHRQSDLGPIAAAGVPLTSGRSLAVDHRLHTFGTPFWVKTKNHFVQKNHPLTRLLIAQDTGSAIIGPQRGDLFIGSGKKAGLLAGQIKHDASMIVFVPELNE